MVFYVEDDPNDVFFVKRAFLESRPDVDLRFAMDGEEGITHLLGLLNTAAPLPCLILLDINMPRLDGFEVLSWIRSQPILKSTPVVMLSSSQALGDRENAAQRGADFYIEKTPQFLGLIDQLSPWLRAEQCLFANQASVQSQLRVA